LKIAVNARMLTQRKPGGIATYARETLRRITRAHPEHDFLFIVDRPFTRRAEYPSNVSVTRTFPSFHPLLWYPWFEWAVPLILKKFAPDIFLSLDGFASLAASVPTVDVIHDLNFHHYPADMPAMISRYYNAYFPKYAKKAKGIATISEYSKRDIVTLYGEPPSKITLTWCGVSDAFLPLGDEDKKKIRGSLAGGAPYFLSVGAVHPRKNLSRLIKAFDQFKDRTNTELKLVLAGPSLFKTGELFQVWNQSLHKKDILFTGTVSNERLAAIYGGAEALLFVSYFEGFGIPALEAMACEIPVVAANRTSLPEVCGQAARYVDPFSVDDIARAMEDIFYDEDLRAHLIETGRRQKENFSWDKTADLLWQAVERGLS